MLGSPIHLEKTTFDIWWSKFQDNELVSKFRQLKISYKKQKKTRSDMSRSKIIKSLINKQKKSYY